MALTGQVRVRPIISSNRDNRGADDYARWTAAGVI